MLHRDTLLLAAANDWIALLVVGFSILSWIISNIKVNKKPTPAPPVRPRPPAAPRPRNEKLQDEISIFIEDLSQRDRAPESRSPAKPAPQARPAAQQTTQNQRGARKRPAEAPAGGGADSNKPAPRRRVSNAGREKHAPVFQDDMAGGDRKLLSKPVESPRMAQELAVDVGARVGQSVNDHLGKFSAGAAPTAQKEITPPVAGRLITLLRNPATVRDAFLINAVLTRPVPKKR